MILIPMIAIVATSLHRDPPPIDTHDTQNTQKVTVTGGEIEGAVLDGIRSYKGIPFAAPPVGPNRWRAPQPVVPWTGVRQTTKFGPVPMQDKAIAVIYSGKPDVKVSEDCLYLNVWTPAKRADEKLPVMVWIYGGGFNTGQTDTPLYDGTSLAKQGVIVVSIAYRVGPFGFLSHPELSRESGHGSGTYGLQDQIAALQWVKNNISPFGGDPNKVTLFGESAGGASTFLLSASPLAKGLFQRVICQSGTPFTPVKQTDKDMVGTPTLAMAEKIGEAFLSRLGAKDIASARALSAETIQKEVKGMGLFPFTNPIDGYVLPGDPYELYKSGKFNYTPILLGSNSDDGGMFTPPGMTASRFKETVQSGFGDKSGAILAVYPADTDAQAAKSARQLVRDLSFGWGTWTWARLQSERAPGSAYLYYFDRHDSKSPDGAAHGADVPYVFGFTNPLFGLSKSEELTFSLMMQRYWTNFAKTGNPNGPDLVSWPAFREPEAKVMRFATGTSIQPLPNLEQLKALGSFFDARYDERRAVRPVRRR